MIEQYVVIRISGRSGSGKTAIANEIADSYLLENEMNVMALYIQPELQDLASDFGNEHRSVDDLAKEWIDDFLEREKDTEFLKSRIAFIYETIDP